MMFKLSKIGTYREYPNVRTLKSDILTFLELPRDKSYFHVLLQKKAVFEN